MTLTYGAAPAIEFSRVVKDYGDVRALRGIDLTVARGQIFGFLGPNGAGKTTAIRLLLDLIRPRAGTVRALGLDCQRDTIDVRRRCGYLPGDLRTYENMLGDDFLDYIDSFRPERRDSAYRAELIERLSLDPTRRIRTLSKGNRQKVGIVQALMHRPDLMILDEPTSGLDPLVQDAVGGLLEDAVKEGRTVFFSSHVLSEVERLAHSVAIIREGEIVAVEDIADLKARSVHVLEVTFAGMPPRFDGIDGVTETRRDAQTLHLQVSGRIDPLIKALAQHEVLDLRTEQASLEDIFLTYYSGKTTEQRRKEEQRASA